MALGRRILPAIGQDLRGLTKSYVYLALEWHEFREARKPPRLGRMLSLLQCSNMSRASCFEADITYIPLPAQWYPLVDPTPQHHRS